jgi:hypothetical protein
MQPCIQQALPAGLDAKASGFELKADKLCFIHCIDSIPEPARRRNDTNVVHMVKAMKDDLIPVCFARFEPPYQLFTTIEGLFSVKIRNKQNTETGDSERFAKCDLLSYSCEG